MSDKEYVEAVVTIRAGADRKLVSVWFESRGLMITEMAAGFLISASEPEFRTAFGLHRDLESLTEKGLPIPIPSDLRDAVDSIIVPKPPVIH